MTTVGVPSAPAPTPTCSSILSTLGSNFRPRRARHRASGSTTAATSSGLSPRAPMMSGTGLWLRMSWTRGSISSGCSPPARSAQSICKVPWMNRRGSNTPARSASPPARPGSRSMRSGRRSRRGLQCRLGGGGGWPLEVRDGGALPFHLRAPRPCARPEECARLHFPRLARCCTT